MEVAQQNHVRKTSGKSYRSDHDLHLQEISNSMSKLNYQGVSMRVTFDVVVGSSLDALDCPNGDAPPMGSIAFQNHDDDQGISSAKGMWVVTP